jgi:hypothetical protein
MSDVIAARLPEPEVARARRPAVLLREVAHALVAAVCPRDRVPRRIRRAVVHDDDLDGVVRLPKDAVDGATDEVRAVEGRDDDADERVRHRAAPPVSADRE